MKKPLQRKLNKDLRNLEIITLKIYFNQTELHSLQSRRGYNIVSGENDDRSMTSDLFYLC